MKSQTVPVRRWNSQGQPSLDRLKAGRLDVAIERAEKALLGEQAAEGYWCYELEADCTIPAEYILMMHFLDDIDEELQAKLARHLRAHQVAEGGWALYYGGALDISGSVKAYYALKLAGDDIHAPHMVMAREAILAHGGAARANVFTRIALAQFGQVPWRAIPFLPVELVLAPNWFPMSLVRVSYWSRTVMVPLLVLCSLKIRARNPRQIGIRELFVNDPEKERHYFPMRSAMNRMLFWLERIGQRLEPLIPRRLRERALAKAEQWIIERLNGLGGLGAIFPAMVNAYEVLHVRGYGPEHPYRKTAQEALQKLLVINGESAYCQPCVSPIWDTGLACLALQAADAQRHKQAIDRALMWMKGEQLLDQPGDWQIKRPNLRGGGWPFQFQNGHYPDLDDTSVVAWAMFEAQDPAYGEAIDRAGEWIAGMQSRNGGFAAFDVDNTDYYLNEIPFADHGALLDPPTSDVTGRCVCLLARLVKSHPEYQDALDRALAYLRREQETNGSWFGRWGTNYIYGTWSVLVGLKAAGIPASDAMIRRAVHWLYAVQHDDGGWGETNDSYHDASLAGQGIPSTPFQTAWALLALMAAGETDNAQIQRGVEYLLNAQQHDGLWRDVHYTAPGFPRVFYLKYHGYTRYFPLWALACYRNQQPD
ncbi:MAG: squalene--hopene cyclase [Gammaproteobacteria bacterium]|nr:squalene--hopene cyclase [Gammaproteobacteria bacterium]